MVARWGAYEPPPRISSFSINFGHGSSGPRDAGKVLHILETATDGDGRFELGAWGPIGVDGIANRQESPLLVVFAAGLMPLKLTGDVNLGPQSLVLAKPSWNEKSLTMAPMPTEIPPYIEALSSLQSALRWEGENDQWKSFPKMAMALQQEKKRIGMDNRKLLGLNHLFGRAGRGELKDAESGESVRGVIGIDWSLRRKAGSELRDDLQVKLADADLSGRGAFYISPWRALLPPFEAWEARPENAPVLRVYAPGYQTVRNVDWPESGKTIRLQKWDQGIGKLAELRSWRKDIDDALSRDGNVAERLAKLDELLWLLDFECRTIPPDANGNICFAADSTVGRYLQSVREKRGNDYSTLREDRYGTYEARFTSQASPRPTFSGCCVQAPSVTGISVESASARRSSKATPK